jgi:CubicO group peptidase (beta-lactamase class C family)
MLVSHTSSFADLYVSNDFTKGADAPGPLNAYLADLLSASGAHYDKGAHYLETAPGAAREYSNLAAGVAGAVAEAVAGESLASFQRRTLFAPLGMTHTSWIIADYGPGELATRYDVRQCAPWTSLCANTEQPEWNEILARVFDTPRRFKTFEAYPQLGNPNYPDGGVNASANDLAILMMTLLNDGVRGETRVLSPENFNEMLRLQAEGIDARQRFFWRDRDGLTGHAGSDLGVFTYFYFDRAKRNGFIVLINRTPDAGTERTMDAIAARVGAEFFKP